MERQKYLTVGEIAKRYGVANFTVTRWVRDGRLPVYDDPTDGRKRLVPLKALVAFEQPRPTRRTYRTHETGTI